MGVGDTSLDSEDIPPPPPPPSLPPSHNFSSNNSVRSEVTFAENEENRYNSGKSGYDDPDELNNSNDNDRDNIIESQSNGIETAAPESKARFDCL